MEVAPPDQNRNNLNNKKRNNGNGVKHIKRVKIHGFI